MTEKKEAIQENVALDDELRGLSHLVLKHFREIPTQYLEGPELKSMLEAFDRGIEGLKDIARLTEAVRISGDPRLAAVLYARLITNSNIPEFKAVTGPYIMSSLMPGLFSLVHKALNRIKDNSMELFNLYYFIPQVSDSKQVREVGTEEKSKGALSRLFSKIGKSFKKKEEPLAMSKLDQEAENFMKEYQKEVGTEEKKTEAVTPAEILAMIFADKYPPETAAFIPDEDHSLRSDAEQICKGFNLVVERLVRCLSGLRNGIIEDCQKRGVHIG